MAHLCGREWSRRELLERVGDLGQIAGAESFTYVDGVRDGVRGVRVRSGSGLDYTVLLSRGMDIAQASYRGTPLAWVSATGAGHPHSLEPEGRGWLRTFHGGLLTGCGLLNAGAANVDGEEPLGIHGHLSHTPAEETFAGTEWQGDEATITVRGTMREARVFDENLRLTRHITSPLGENRLTISDRVENAGWKRTPLMLLYHLNFGWPLVSEETEIVFPASAPSRPRDAEAQKGANVWNRLEAPQAGYAEQCFFHEPVSDARGTAVVMMVNRALNLAVRIAYDKRALPYLTQWKMMGQGEYVCGIEPANCLVLGRAQERAAGRLQYIEPGGERQFTVTLDVLEGPAAIADAESALKSPAS
jgi:hypothetical protein